MKYLGLLISLCSLTFGIYHHWLWFSIPLMILGLSLHLKIGSLTNHLVWVSLLYLSFAIIARMNPPQRSMTVVILDRRDTWLHVKHLSGDYYLEITLEDDFETGDWLSIQGSRVPLAITTYESLFNFQDYLNQRGIRQQIIANQITILFRNPIRTQAIRKARLQQLPASLQTLVSELLWNRSSNRTVDDDSALRQAIGLSGLGLFFVILLSKKILFPFFKPRHYHLIITVFLIPWILTNLGHSSSLRVYLIFALQSVDPRLNLEKRKMIILSLLTIVYPSFWLQRGNLLYLIYQLVSVLVFPLFPSQSFFQSKGKFVVFSLLLQWGMDGSISLFSSLFYLPSLMVQSVLFWLWLPYLYFGLRLPGLTLITEGFKHMYMRLTVMNLPIHLGIPTLLITLAMVLTLMVMASFVWLKLNQDFQKAVILLAFLSLIHVGGVDAVMIQQIHFINVGQGDATLIQSGRRGILIDTGGQRSFDLASEVLIPYFRKQRIHSLDAVIITHNDFDHDGALPSLQKHFPILRLYREEFAKFKLDRFSIESLANVSISNPENDNERSLIILIAWKSCRLLVMGDATVNQEQLIIKQYPHLRVPLLRIGHHGSLTSTSGPWIDHLQVETAIISVGGNNRYGHPHPDVLNTLSSRSIKILRTDIDGTIRMQTCKI